MRAGPPCLMPTQLDWYRMTASLVNLGILPVLSLRSDPFPDNDDVAVPLTPLLQAVLHNESRARSR